MGRTTEKPFVGLKNYLEVFQQPRFLNSLRVSTLFTALSVGFELIVGLGLAYLFNGRLPRWISLMKPALILPMAIAPMAVALMWRWFFSTQFGIINYLLSLAYIPGPEWHARASWSILSLAIADTWEWAPFVFLILLAAMQGIPDYLYEAADVDGASAVEKFRFITWPLLQPAILVVILFRTVFTFRELAKAAIMTQGGPGTATETVSYWIYRTFFWYRDVGQAVAMSFILLVIVILLCQLLMRVMRGSS